MGSGLMNCGLGQGLYLQGVVSGPIAQWGFRCEYSQSTIKSHQTCNPTPHQILGAITIPNLEPKYGDWTDVVWARIGPTTPQHAPCLMKFGPGSVTVWCLDGLISGVSGAGTVSGEG
jgi:hypothetical protein